jgi:hypothetical protein
VSEWRPSLLDNRRRIHGTLTTPVLLRCMATNSRMASVGCIATNSREARFSIGPPSVI